jgi:hypothetical protein
MIVKRPPKPAARADNKATAVVENLEFTQTGAASPPHFGKRFNHESANR